MRNIVEITSEFRHVLSHTNGAGDRVYPIIANEGTVYPFIVYERTGFDVVYSKDGYTQQRVNFTVKVVASDYFSTLKICEEISALLSELNRSDYIEYRNISIDSATEEYTNDAYVQTLSISFDAYTISTNNDVLTLSDSSTYTGGTDTSTGTDPTPTLIEYTITDDSFSSNNNVVGITLSDNGALQGLAASDIVIYTNSGATVTLQSIDNGFHAIRIRRATSANANFTITILAHNGYAETTKTLQWNYIQIDNEE